MFVYVHVTSVPATRSTVAVPVARSAEPPGVQVRPVKLQPGRPRLSNTAYWPGSRSPNAWLLERVGSVSSSSAKNPNEPKKLKSWP